MHFKKIFGKLKGGNILYYPGCLTHFILPHIEQNYMDILRKLDIDFIFLPDFNCCGSPVRHTGYKEDYEKLKNQNINIFNQYSITKIITNCPACYKILSDYGLNVEHITQTISMNLNKLKAKNQGKITYHDPCHLGRHSGIYDEPRNILKHIGFKLVELPFCREKSLCCGAGGGLKTNCPALSNDISKKILEMTETKKLVTPCPMCYKHFKENAEDIEVFELSEVLIDNEGNN